MIYDDAQGEEHVIYTDMATSAPVIMTESTGGDAGEAGTESSGDDAGKAETEISSDGAGMAETEISNDGANSGEGEPETGEKSATKEKTEDSAAN